MKKTTFLAAALGAALAFPASAGTYTWLASPASATWNTSALNWSDGTTSGVAWADDQSAPNDAVFGTSSKTTVSVPSARYVGDLTLNTGTAYTFNGTGPLSIAGTITSSVIADRHFAVPLASGRADGMLQLYASGGTWRSFWLDSSANKQSGTVLGGTVYCMIGSDGALGVRPSVPTENIFIDGTPTIFGGAAFSVNANRTIKLSSGSSLQTGSNNTFTYDCMIVADPDEGSDYSTDTSFSLVNWTGLVVLNPGASHTNSFGRLSVPNNRRLKLASGVTMITGPGGTGTSANMYVQGPGTAFTAGKGHVLIDGGELYNPQRQTFYVDVNSYGQVTVTNGGKVYMPQAEWLNGLGSPGLLTVAKDGVFDVGYLRLSQSGTSNTSEIHLDEGGTIVAAHLYMDNPHKAVFTFNGGTFRSRENTGDGRALFQGSAEKWAKVTFSVGEKGGVFDAAGQNIFWDYPLTSGVSGGVDGGIRKTGSRLMILRSTNAYSGPTVVEGGNLCPRVDGSLPDGTVVRLAGGDLDFNSYETLSPVRNSTNWVSRLEGSGNVNNCSALHVTNAIAPSIGGTIGFTEPLDLRGDYEISADATDCSCIYFKEAGQELSGLKLKLANPGGFDKDKLYRIVRAPNGYDGAFDESALQSGWQVVYEENAIYLKFPKPFMMVVR